jgi:hypothetical protein
MSSLNAAPIRNEVKPSWARVVSDLISPPVVWTVLAFPLALTETAVRSSAIAAATLYGFIVCWLPVMFVAWMVKRGRITDIHMKLRRQRILPFGVSITCSAGGLGMLWMAKASTMLLLFGFATFVGLIIMAFVTFFWQISIHAMSITSAFVVTAIVFGTAAAMWVMPLVPVVAAARLSLHRHTPAQLLAGGLVGIMVPSLVFLI